jgi:2-C-methyl-D-erythritol 4-phosphate cytidylyltransferase
MHLLIAAAGSGRRMGAEINKLLLPVAGRSVLAWTLDAALACEDIHWIGVMGQPEDGPTIAAILAAAGPAKPVQWILGGPTRQDSVRLGLAALPEEAEAVLIHDGARCLATPDLFSRCAGALRDAIPAGAGIIAATPVSDSATSACRTRRAPTAICSAACSLTTGPRSTPSTSNFTSLA